MNTKEDKKSDVALREEVVLAFWKEHDIFNKSLEKEAPNGDFVFYDGPPFATGLPHYGHILASAIKDTIPRFWTMNGYRVERKWGWDCHGLPLENLIEKKLGLATKRDIEEYGIQNFNEAARDAVMEYADEWKRIIPRMGRWADMEDDYKTMDSTYTESVWWVFKSLYEKGLVYEGFKTMHLCPRCGTTLSNFEVNQGYKDIKDISVTVKLPLVDEPDTSLLVWTTTPWTLPGNMAAAVHEEVDYVKVKVTTDEGDAQFILAKARLVQLGDMPYEVLQEMKGSELVGKSYIPPFDYILNAIKSRDIIITNAEDGELNEETIKKYAWKIHHADYVEIGEDGTGAVHIAPAYGDDDMKLAQANDIPIVHHVDASGRFMNHIGPFAAQLVKPKDDDDSGVTHLDADIEIVRALKASGALLKKENITHSYPHCWRCDTPLLNYATTSWFVEVTKIKEQLVAENNKVNWVPEHVGTNRFGKWLDGARDWAVSRQRYWGAPLPIWRNAITKDYKVLGSLAEIQQFVPKSGNTYLLMRHAEAESNLTGVIDAVDDGKNPLTEKGKQQASTVAKELKDKKVDIIIHSGMQRTRETAEILATALGLPAASVTEDARMIELQTGSELEGKMWSEYEEHFTSVEEKFTKEIPGIENRMHVQKRAGDFLYDIDATYKGKTIVIVGHASSTFAFRSAAEGADLKRAQEIRDEGYMGNAEVTEVPFTPMPHNDNYVLDYHRPYIDDIKLFDGDVQLERVPDVFDCWFESGSMPYAQNHYPFENLDTFNCEKGTGFPADFIAEGTDQTRGWFYSLIVLGTALFGKSPYKNVIVNGLALAEDGKKMSKSLQNYPDPMYVADSAGADAMRFYLLTSPIVRAEDLNFSEKGVLELQRKNIGRLHNVLAMYEQYTDGTEASGSSENVLDRWIIARLNQLIAEATEGFKNYELDKATRPATDFIDDVSVWYLRRSRERLKGDDKADKKATLGTLRYVLQQLSLVMAPSMPFYAEYLWGRVKTEEDEESVHLANWPKGGEIDEDLIATMLALRNIVTFALEARTKVGIKVRQPLAKLFVSARLVAKQEEFAALIRDEVNVKEIEFDSTLTKPVRLDVDITPELQAEGDMRELVRQIQDMRKKAGLEPQDRVVLIVQTSDGGEELITLFKSEIQKVVGADEMTFGDAEGTEINAGGHSFTIQITKV